MTTNQYDQQTATNAKTQDDRSPPPKAKSVTGDKSSAKVVPPGSNAPRTKAPTAGDKASELDANDAYTVLYAAWQALGHEQNYLTFKITSKNSSYVAAVDKLHVVAVGRDTKTGATLTPAQKRDLFVQARNGLQPLVDVSKSDLEAADFADQYYTPRINNFDQSLSYDAAKERVDNSTLGKDGTVKELAPDSEPHDQGRELHEKLQTLVDAMKTINEQLIRLKDDHLEKEAEEMLKGEHGGRYGTLAEFANVLLAADTWLTLTDGELKEHLKEVQGVFNGVATYTELLKAILEATIGGAGLVCSMGALISRAAGETELAAMCAGTARSIGTATAFGSALAGIEAAHGIAVLLDSHAPAEKKLTAAKDLAAAGAWFAGKKAGGKAMGTVMGFAASTAVLLGYAELKLAISAYSGTVIGIDSAMLRGAYSTLAYYGDQIPPLVEEVAKAHGLIEEESDPEKKAALARVEQTYVTMTASTLDGLIDACAPADTSNDKNAKYVQMRDFKAPGQSRILQQLFAPLTAFKQAKTADAVIQGAALALKNIVWAREHAKEVLAAEVVNGNLEDAQEAAKKAEEKKAEENRS